MEEGGVGTYDTRCVAGWKAELIRREGRKERKTIKEMGGTKGGGSYGHCVKWFLLGRKRGKKEGKGERIGRNRGSGSTPDKCGKTSLGLQPVDGKVKKGRKYEMLH